ncbi:MAG: hypothetical protein LQ346_006821 [Caloplaca aetnensis]|nr:MAG: hypothetical protein LQ346_006821 [Caloplaca aetnensis]
MTGFIFALSNLILLFFVASTIQVDIILNSFQGHGRGPHVYDVAVCPRQPAGVCCQAPESVFNSQRILHGFGASRVTFRHLLPGDIGGVFQAGNTAEVLAAMLAGGPSNYRLRAGCSSTLLNSVFGPGESSYSGTFIGGASYISLGQVHVPPDSRTLSLLDFQGVFGLVWGGGQWFASASAQKRFGRRNPKERRGIRSALKGTAYIKPPFRWVYPAYIMANGTNYMNSGNSDLAYTSADGKVLNLTMPYPV